MIEVIAHWLVQPKWLMEIGYHLIPRKKDKGCGAEVVQMMADYLLLSRCVVFRCTCVLICRKAKYKFLCG